MVLTRRLLALAILAAGLLTWPVPAGASDNGQWAVMPTPPADPGPTPRLYFFLEAPPGQVIVDSVRIANLTDHELSFVVHGADAYNTERDGGFGLRSGDEQQHDVGAWTSLAARNVVVPAKTQADVPFTITVPVNATPGDHVGGLVALESAPSGQTTQGGATLNVQRAVGARVYLRVTGPVTPGLSVDKVSLSSSGAVDFAVANTGNVHLAPEVKVGATGLFGHQVRSTKEQPQLDLVPGARTTLSGRLDGYWPIDLVTTTVAVKADGGVSAQASSTRLVVAWWPLAVLAALIGAGVYAVVQRRRRSRVRPRVVRA